MKMRRTQLYLDDETHRLAAWQARMIGSSVSEVIRLSIRHYVEKKPRRTKKELLDWLSDFHKKYPTPPGSPTDLALEHDHYLYGTPKKYENIKR